jgi:hypothetical protein
MIRRWSARHHAVSPIALLARATPHRTHAASNWMEEFVMKTLATIAVGALVIASPAPANHILNLDTPYPSRGACESESAQFSNDDAESLVERFPQFFSGIGEVKSFLTRAFTCDLDESDGQWYIHDHRQEVLDSEWFQRR